MDGILLVRGKDGKFNPLTAIIGQRGDDGKSAYQYAQENGYTGTEEDFSIALSNIGDLNVALDEIITIQDSYIAQSPLPVDEGGA